MLSWLHVAPKFDLGLECLFRQFFLIRPYQTNLISNLKHICDRNMFYETLKFNHILTSFATNIPVKLKGQNVYFQPH